VRILGSVLGLTAVGMTLAGAAVYAVQAARINDRIDRDISQEVQEFARFQRTGIDPETGEPFTDLSRLFEVALQRNVADEHQTILAFVDGRVAFYSQTGSASRLVRSSTLLRAVSATLSSDPPRSEYGSINTPAGPVRFAVLPVTAGESRGAWVVTYLTEREGAEFGDVMRTYVVVALAALLVVGAVGWFVAGALLAPVRVVRQTAQEIGETDLSRRIEVTGTDDVSALASTFNAMLDRIEGAFTAQRAFLDDAGHELRTPITVVRGNIELLDATDPQEVEEVRDLVLGELDRMSRLVDDLTLLAKAERPDFVRPGPIELVDLTDDIVSRLPALAARDWRVDARADGTVLGDPQRLTQAVLQLAANAVRVTGAGDEIGVGTRVDPVRREVSLWLRDTGPGVPPEDQPRIFERFARGRDADPADGSGLGLAIVAAIAEGHAGRATVDSVAGGGATFTISFPCVRPQAPARLTQTGSGRGQA
jgi:two-component system OmpR family sensor kinase